MQGVGECKCAVIEYHQTFKHPQHQKIVIDWVFGVSIECISLSVLNISTLWNDVLL